MLRKSNCNRMQLLILIVWPVLSEDAIKHIWYPMVGKTQKHEHNCYMHQLWSMRKYCRITPSFIPRSSQSLSLTLCWEGLRCSYHIICRTDSLAVHTGHDDLWHLCHKSVVKTVLHLTYCKNSNSMETGRPGNEDRPSYYPVFVMWKWGSVPYWGLILDSYWMDSTHMSPWFTIIEMICGVNCLRPPSPAFENNKSSKTGG